MAEDQDPQRPPEFEAYPLTRSEYIGAMVHFYRGERGRAEAWRARLDPTTNWAIGTAGAMLSFAFGAAGHSHVTVLVAELLVLVFLGIEARRYRYFDVWRARVRMLEENFFVPIILRDLASPRADWRELVAHDLDRPTFKITFLEAVAVRLRYNYLWIFLVLFFAWLAKLNAFESAQTGLSDLLLRMAIGPIPGRGVLVGVLLAHLGVVTLALLYGREGSDEIWGLVDSREEWKT